MRRLLPLLVLVLAAGCSRTPSPEKIVPKEDVDFAQRFLSYLAARDFAALEQSMDPKLDRKQLRTRLEQLARNFPPDSPRSVKLVGALRRQSGTTAVTNVTLEYEYPSSWLVAEVVFQRTPAGVIVQGMHVQPMRESLASLNRFTFAGKGVWHYIFFAVVVLVPTVMGYALFLVLRTPQLPLRWLWAFFVLVGVGQASLNWTTNRINLGAMSLQLLGSGYVRASPVSPIVLTTSLPLGAILFLIKRATGFGDWEEEEEMGDGATGAGEATDPGGRGK